MKGNRVTYTLAPLAAVALVVTLIVALGDSPTKIRASVALTTTPAPATTTPAPATTTSAPAATTSVPAATTSVQAATTSVPSRPTAKKPTSPTIPTPYGHRPALPYVGTDYGPLFGPPPPARVITDGFISCTFPNDVYYYIKYSTGYSQVTQVHYTNVGSVYWIFVDSWGKLLPYAMGVTYTAQDPPTGIHFGQPMPGCSYWKSS